MKTYFEGKQRIELYNFIINLINGELDLPKREKETVENLVRSSLKNVYGDKKIKQDDVTRVQPYNEHDNDYYHIDLNVYSEKTGCERFVVVTTSTTKDNFTVHITEKAEPVFDMMISKDLIECVSSSYDENGLKNDETRKANLKDESYTIATNKNNEITVVSMEDSKDEPGYKTTFYFYQIQKNGNKKDGVLRLVSQKDANGKPSPKEILRRLDIIFATAMDPKYKIKDTKKSKSRIKKM